jgi:hypothetical protein
MGPPLDSCGYSLLYIELFFMEGSFFMESSFFKLFFQDPQCTQEAVLFRALFLGPFFKNPPGLQKNPFLILATLESRISLPRPSRQPVSILASGLP